MALKFDTPATIIREVDKQGRGNSSAINRLDSEKKDVDHLLSIDVAGSTDITLSEQDTYYSFLEFTGALTGNISVIAPTTVNTVNYYNNTSGAFTLTVETVDGTGILLDQGSRKDLSGDGTDIIAVSTEYTHPNHTGDVTSTGDGATVIGAKKVTLSMMEDGTDGELITYDSSGVAAKVPVGTLDQVLTSNGAGAAPTFQDAAVAQAFSPDKSQWPIVENDTDADHDIKVLVGSILDSTATSIITTTVMTKQIDAAWAAGNNLGGIFTGSVAADTTYHFFIIVKDSDDSVDAGFDTSLSAANIPAGYTAYRRIASFITDATSNLRAFKQSGDFFLYTDGRIEDINTTSPGTTTVTVGLTVPSGVELQARLSAFLNKGSTADILISNPDATLASPTTGNTTLTVVGGATRSRAELDVLTNTTGQIKYRSNATSVDGFQVATIGFTDTRIA